MYARSYGHQRDAGNHASRYQQPCPATTGRQVRRQARPGRAAGPAGRPPSPGPAPKMDPVTPLPRRDALRARVRAWGKLTGLRSQAKVREAIGREMSKTDITRMITGTSVRSNHALDQHRSKPMTGCRHVRLKELTKPKSCTATGRRPGPGEGPGTSGLSTTQGLPTPATAESQNTASDDVGQRTEGAASSSAAQAPDPGVTNAGRALILPSRALGPRPQ
jgi:hypothetical protein